MGIKEATRSRCSSYAPVMSPSQDVMIIARCGLFVLALMAVPTIMAILKQWGWW